VDSTALESLLTTAQLTYRFLTNQLNPDRISVVIQKKGRKWVLYTSDGSRVLGTHSSYDAALAQERAIQVNKRIRARHNPSDDETEFAPKIKMSSLGLSLPRPLRVFHAGLNVNLICENGFKFRKELDVSAAGGGPDNAISFTGDARVAEAVCVTLGTLIRLFNRNLHPRDLLEEMKIACPNGLSEKLSTWSKDVQNRFLTECDEEFCSDKHIEDVVGLYRDVLSYANYKKEVYDPYIATVDAEQYKREGIDQIKYLGYVASYIPSSSLIFPSSGSSVEFRGFFKYRLTGDLTALSEQNLRLKRIDSSGYFSRLPLEYLSDEAKHIIEAASPYVINTVDFDTLFPVSYLDSMNEYRVWNKNSINNNDFNLKTQTVKYLLEMYEDTLPALWGTDRVKSFYPYFEQKTLLENLSEYHPQSGTFN